MPPNESTNTSSAPLYLCQPFVRAALVTGKFKTIVALPRYGLYNQLDSTPNLSNTIDFLILQVC